MLKKIKKLKLVFSFMKNRIIRMETTPPINIPGYKEKALAEMNGYTRGDTSGDPRAVSYNASNKEVACYGYSPVSKNRRKPPPAGSPFGDGNFDDVQRRQPFG